MPLSQFGLFLKDVNDAIQDASQSGPKAIHPSDLAMGLSGLCSSGYNSADLMEASAKYLIHDTKTDKHDSEAMIQNFGSQDICVMFSAIAKFGHPDEVLLTSIIHRIYELVPEFNDVALGSICNSLARIEYHDRKLLHKLSIRVIESLKEQSWNPVSIANVINGLARLNFRHAALFGNIERYVADRVHLFDPKSVILTMNGFAKVDIPCPVMISEAIDQLRTSFNLFTPQCWSNCLCAIAKFHKHLQPRSVHEFYSEAGSCLEKVSNLENFLPQHLASIVIAFSKVGVLRPTLLNIMSLEIQRKEDMLNAQDVSNIANGFSRFVHVDHELIRTLCRRSVTIITFFKQFEFASWLNSLWIILPRAYSNVFQHYNNSSHLYPRHVTDALSIARRRFQSDLKVTDRPDDRFSTKKSFHKPDVKDIALCLNSLVKLGFGTEMLMQSATKQFVLQSNNVYGFECSLLLGCYTKYRLQPILEDIRLIISATERNATPNNHDRRAAEFGDLNFRQASSILLSLVRLDVFRDCLAATMFITGRLRQMAQLGQFNSRDAAAALFSLSILNSYNLDQSFNAVLCETMTELANLGGRLDAPSHRQLLLSLLQFYYLAPGLDSKRWTLGLLKGMMSIANSIDFPTACSFSRDNYDEDLYDEKTSPCEDLNLGRNEIRSSDIHGDVFETLRTVLTENSDKRDQPCSLKYVGASLQSEVRLFAYQIDIQLDDI